MLLREIDPRLGVAARWRSTFCPFLRIYIPMAPPSYVFFTAFNLLYFFQEEVFEIDTLT